MRQGIVSILFPKQQRPLPFLLPSSMGSVLTNIAVGVLPVLDRVDGNVAVKHIVPIFVQLSRVFN